MTKYRVMLQGEPVSLLKDGVWAEHGFFTTRFVDTSTPEQAAEIAQELVYAELTSLLGLQGRLPPYLTIEEIEERDAKDPYPLGGQGFTLYPMDPDNLGAIANPSRSWKKIINVIFGELICSCKDLIKLVVAVVAKRLKRN